MRRSIAISDRETEGISNILESVTDGVHVFDAENRIVLINSRARALHLERGVEPESLLGHRVFEDCFPEMRHDAWGRAYLKAAKERVTVEVEYFYEAWRKWYQSRFYPTADGGLAVFCRDITDRKFAVQQLQISHAVTAGLARAQGLDEFADAIMGGICHATGADFAALWSLERTTNCLQCLKTYAREPMRVRSFLEQTQELRLKFGEGLPGRAWKERRAVWIADVASDDNFPRWKVAAEANLHGAFASPIFLNEKFFGVVEFFLSQRREPDEMLLQLMEAISLQIAQFLDRKEAEDTAREAEGRFQVMADACSALVWLATADGKRCWFNRSWLDFVGDPMDVEVGSGWIQHVHPDDAPECLKSYSLAFDRREPWEMEYRLRRRDGEYRWMRVRAVPTKGIETRLEGYVGCCIDVTDARLKTDELERVVDERTRKLRQSIMDLEALSYGIIHDLRAPLRSMHAWSQFLLEEVGQSISPEGKACAERIASSARRMDQLVQDVVSYGRVLRTDFKLTPVDCDCLIREIVASYPELSECRGEIEILGRLPVVMGTEAGMTQVLSNLLRNAIKFVPPDRVPHVRVWSEMRPRAGPPAGKGSVRIWVEDNGIGIAREHWEKIFKMFERLSSAFDGTGIGLAIVQKTIERFGGEAGVESVLGEGSRFWIDLELVGAMTGPDYCTAARRESNAALGTSHGTGL